MLTYLNYFIFCLILFGCSGPPTNYLRVSLPIRSSFLNSSVVSYSYPGKIDEYAKDNASFSFKSVDVNLDGYKDLVYTSNANRFSVRLNNQDGTFSAATNYATTGANFSLDVADLNRDYYPDVIVADATNDQLSVLLNNGDGTFGALTGYATGLYPSDVASSDIDRDGDLDLVSLNDTGDNLSVFVNDGTGNFGAATNYATGDSPDSLILIDLNHDDYVDLVNTSGTGFGITNYVNVRLNNGAGVFGGNTQYNIGISPGEIVAADFDGDTHIDVVYAETGTGNFCLRPGDGTGLLGASSCISPSAGVNSLVSYDRDGDGDEDIFITSNNHEITEYANDGVGNFSATSIIYPGEASRIEFSDVNQDQKIDLLGGNGATLFVKINRGNLATDNMTELDSTASNPVSIHIEDFDHDGNQDIITSNYGSNRISLFLGNGSGSFPSVTNFATGNVPFEMTVADLNGDTFKDVVTADSSDNQISVFINDGIGGFLAGVAYPMGGSNYDVASCDIELDGDIDVITADQSDDSYSIRLNNGSGVFGARTQVSVGVVGAQPYFIDCKDFNGDFYPDFILSYYGTGFVSTHINNQNGTFTETATYPHTLGYAVKLQDLTNDGYPELISVGGNNGGIEIRRNDGLGNYGAIVSNLTPSDYVFNVSFGDINNDGNIDMVASNYNSARITLHYGQGDGTFNSTPEFFGTIKEPGGIVLKDVNNDGRPDIGVAGTNATSVGVYLRQPF